MGKEWCCKIFFAIFFLAPTLHHDRDRDVTVHVDCCGGSAFYDFEVEQNDDIR